MRHTSITYTAKTENGIPYVAALYGSSFEYQTVVDDLDALFPARRSVISGSGSVTQYSIGARSISKQTLTAKEVLSTWDALWARKQQLEGLRGGVRKSVAIVPRDW